MTKPDHADSEWHAEPVTERRFPQLPSRSTRIAIYLVLLAVLLGVNYWGAHRVIQETRIRVPYSPFFLEQVRADNVVTVTSTASELQGDFKHATKPAGSSTASVHFVTEIPSFADTNQLSRLLQEHGVVVNAKPLDTVSRCGRASSSDSARRSSCCCSCSGSSGG